VTGSEQGVTPGRDVVDASGEVPESPGLERIGQVLRETRTARRMRLKDVAEQVGCTVSMLSKIETG
jgi:hypothetical protein